MKLLNNLPGRVAVSAVILSAALSGEAETLNKSFSGQPYLDTSLGGTTDAARPELDGTVLEDVLTPFSFAGISGTVQNRVVRETGTGTLDFYWRVLVNPEFATVEQGAISAFRLVNFGYDSINDADWRIDGLGTAAPYTGRVFDPATAPQGDINFLFSDGLVQPGSSSRFFFLHTDATDYAETAQYDLLDNRENITGLFPTFAPAASGVPDGGSTSFMVLVSLAGMALGVRR